MPFHYYTTAEQEAALAKIYTDALAVKQAEIDETQHRTRKIPKFNARGHVSRSPRVFDVSGSQISLEGFGPCSSEPHSGGATYTTEAFKQALDSAISKLSK